MIIRGNTVSTNMPRTDYAQTDETKADFLKNKPTNAIEKAQKTADAALPKAGGTMEGAINMNGQKLSGLNAPTEDDEAATKGYVDKAKPDLTGYATETYVNQQMKKAAPRNLLDNSEFSNPINQRCESGYYGNRYTIDRWYVWSPENNGNMVIADNHVAVKANAGTVSFQQRFEKGILNSEATYTLAYMNTDGSVICKHDSVGFQDDYDYVEIGVNPGETINLVWAALYEGEYTAETLPEYQPKGYGAELVECQRYYRNYEEFFIVLNTKNTLCSLRGFAGMRIAPTVGLTADKSYSGTILGKGSTTITPSAVYPAMESVTLSITTELTPGDILIIQHEVSADL